MKIPKIALPHRVTIIPFLGSGAYGKTWETDPAKFRRNVPCVIESKRRNVKSRDGDDIVQTGEAIFQHDVGIKVNDKVIWDDYGLEFTVSDWIPVEAMGPHSIEVVLS